MEERNGKMRTNKKKEKVMEDAQGMGKGVQGK